MKNSRFCFTHNPETKDAKKLAVIKGGKSPKKNLNPLPPIEIYNNKDVVKVADIEERVERLEKIMNPKKRFGRR